MKQKSKRQESLNKHHKTKRKADLPERVNLWFVEHSTIANILDASVLLFSAIGIFFLLYGTSLISSPYRELHYSFPLYLNLVVLLNASYQTFFRSFKNDWITLREFAKMFLFLNGIAFVLQLTIGMTSKGGTRLLPIWELDHRYIWFPIATYLIFFSLASIITLVMNYIEKKRSQS